VIKVSFFEDRALVERTETRSLQSGKNELSWSGLSPVLDDLSVQLTTAAGGVQILSSRVRRRLVAEDAQPLENVRRQVQAATAEVQRLRRQLDACRQRREELGALLQHWLGELGKQTQTAGETWDATYEELATALNTEFEQHSLLQRDIELAEQDLHRRASLLQVAETRQADVECIVEAVLHSDAAQEVELQLVYRTACALWRPEHVARLVGDRVQLTMLGAVWQATGENWQQVQALLSTARPSQLSEPPLLHDDVLSLRPKSEEEKKTVRVEVREQHVARAGLESEMPGVDDGGEAVTFLLGDSADLPSDGHPVRVQIARTELPCAVDRVAYPELSDGVYVRATLSHDGFGQNWPLLAGPVRVTQDATLVGRTTMPLVAPGERFELSFGVDDALRTRRFQEMKRETVPVLGTQKLTFLVTVTVSNLSDQPARLRVLERLPVSELSDVKVTQLKPLDVKPNADGLLEWAVEVAANSCKELELQYRIEAAARVRLPW
jgi:uncharacterized protein (TIGR02231 family)